MNSHLTPEEWIAAADGGLAASRQAHVAACPVCREEIARVGELLTRVAQADVPEPSPLFWDHFSSRVREATRQEPVRPPRSAVAAWASLLAAAATVVFAVWVVRQPLPEVPRVDGQVPAADDGPADWSAVVALAEGASDDVILDWDGRADGTGIEDLTPAERAIFVRLLEQEMDVIQ